VVELVAFIDPPVHWWQYPVRAVAVLALWAAGAFVIGYCVTKIKWWWRSHGSAHRPETNGHVEKAEWDYNGRDQTQGFPTAEIWYNYEVNGERYAQVVKRDFANPDQATNYVMACAIGTCASDIGPTIRKNRSCQWCCEEICQGKFTRSALSATG
jgi:hypothetical protein